MKKNFLNSDLFMYLMLVFIAPLGVFLMWKKGKFNKKARIAVSIVALLFMFGVIGTSEVNSLNLASSNTTVNESNENSNKEIAENKDSKKETTKNEAKEKANDKKDQVTENNSTDNKEDIFKGYKLITVDGGDLSGHREPNVVVDIGFGDREYYAFTNEYGQLVKVIAKKIIVQDDSTEPVTSKGRYYNDEAKVPGTESKSLDEGHVIADSLGGVSNAYNITPQNSTLNRHGDQAYMEDSIRKAGGCTDFVAIITYPNTTTQIPSHYSYTYTLKGNVIKDEFDNINPDEYNANLDKNNSSSNSSNNNSNSSNSNNKPTSNTNNNNNNSSSNNSGSEVVYWTPKGDSYHTRKSCPTLSRSKTILEGTLKQSGKSDPCDKCH